MTHHTLFESLSKVANDIVCVPPMYGTGSGDQSQAYKSFSTHRLLERIQGHNQNADPNFKYVPLWVGQVRQRLCGSFVFLHSEESHVAGLHPSHERMPSFLQSKLQAHKVSICACVRFGLLKFCNLDTSWTHNCSVTHSWICCKTWTLLGHCICTSIPRLVHCAFLRLVHYLYKWSAQA